MDKVALLLDGIIALAKGFSFISSAIAGEENTSFNRSVSSAESKLDQFRKKLKDVGFDLRKLPKDTKIQLDAKTNLGLSLDPKVLEDFKNLKRHKQIRFKSNTKGKRY